MRQSLLFSLICVFLLMCTPAMGFSNDDARDAIPIQFAVMFDHADAVAGSAACTRGMRCELLQSQMPPMEITLKIDRQGGALVSELELRCSESCSFSSGRRRVTIGKERSFEIFVGEDSFILSPVLRPRSRIGWLLLIYPDGRRNDAP
ncbi:hypothetical protein [Rhizobium sp. HT1-10]|uniref:hypothetical protein n=1 Tax=Rhizobium sp. HT1-10 TaxID=3111638 RepID=UPI003C28628D